MYVAKTIHDQTFVSSTAVKRGALDRTRTLTDVIAPIIYLSIYLYCHYNSYT